MSNTSIDMPATSQTATSTGNSVLVVETSANSDEANLGTLIPQQPQQQPQQQQQQQQTSSTQNPQLVQITQATTNSKHTGQQVQSIIIKEDFINSDNYFHSNNNLLNNAQIIKFVNDEQAALLESQQQQQSQTNQQVLKEPIEQPTQIYSGSQQISGVVLPNSKVHVIGNMAMVAKTPQHQTSNNQIIQTTGTQGYSIVNAKHLQSGNNLVAFPAGGKLVNIPMKQQSTTTLGTHQIVQTGGTKQPVQSHKMTVARNVQLVTRIQSLAPNQQQIQSNVGNQPTIINNQIVNRAPGSTTTTVQQHHPVQHQPQTFKVVHQQSATTTGAISKRVTPKKNIKKALGTSMKIIHGKTTNYGDVVNVNTTGTLNNNNNNNVQKTNTNRSNVMKQVHHTNVYSNQQILNSGTGYNQLKPSNNSQLSKALNYSMNNKLHTVQVHHSPSTIQIQQPHRNVNSIYVQQQPQLIQPGQKVTTKPGAKYMMHTTNNALPHQHTTIVMSGVNSSTGQQQNVKLSNVQQQQHQLVTSNGSGNGGAIKYVNSMGNVISSTMHPSGPVTKVGRSQMSPQFNTTVVYNENGENIRTFNSDELYMANGNNMSEEMVSARILQSLSQPKTIHLNNNKQYHHNQNQVVQQKVKHIGPAAGGYVGGQSIPQPIYLSPSSATPSDFHSFGQHATVHSSGGEMKSIKLPDTFRVNPSDLHGTTTTFIDNIPLLSSKSDLVNQPNVAEQEDDIIGEEVIPAPIADGGDEKVNLLHAVLQDHSYVDMSHRVPRIGSCVESVKNSSTYSRYYGTSGSTTKSSTIAGLSKLSGFSSNVDDDAQSVISTGSRTAGDLNDIDLGEETETAPECEGEDDSVTRCICDLTHDDGYMICCDKCSTWQHVDCMGIDRQNIPDEYKCEICQPRPVDKERARSLQLLKRKEQQNLMLLNSQQQTPPHGSLNTHLVANSHGENKNMLHKMPGNITSSKKARLNQRRKGDGPLNSNKKKQRNDSTSSLSNRLSGKRRDCKKPSKRKTKLQSQLDSAEKHAANMRSWIENYEEANTNHYSPELRARLHAMSKQPQSTAKSTVKGITNLDAKCTTVPHAGGKILISTLDLNTQQPIVEIRGKYMLSCQCKSAVTSPTTTSVSTTSQKNGYGPFLFYYRLPNDGPEICVDTRTYGNNARFVRRSCRPNAELTYSIEKGTIHLYIVASSPIRCNTEITIPHDDQDIMAIKKGSYNVGNSPVCACGLTKDCVIASMTQPNQIQQPSTTTTQPTTPKLTKRLNGHNKADSSTQRKTKSMSSRGRSTSSSGESNMGLLSPNGAQTCIIHPPSVSSITSLMHDSGVYTSSSSPSISLPSPTRTTNLVATPKESPQTEIPLIPTKPIASKLVEKVEADSTAIILPPKVKEEINTNESSDKVNVHQKTHKTPVKTPRKMSEDATKEIKTEGDLNSSQSAQKKMTREERKLEAYLQAFAKMEKSQQRRKETKQHKSSSSKSSSPMKENKESPFSTTKRPLAGGIRKKKRKGSKSYQQLSNSQKRKRQKRLNSGDSDVFTSEESLLSPNSLNQRSTGHDRDSKSRNENENDDDKAAGLLLAFSNQPGKSPQKLSRYDPNSYQLSSACLLVEAAVAPLENSENDFKVPPKTKTKKTIMNDWLHHSDSNFNSPTSESSNGFTGAYGCSEQSEILCFNAAQKVEEFINLQSQGTDTTDSKWQSGNYYGTVGEVQTVPSPLPTPPLPGSSCGSSVKKRWLRQAISEECSDEQNASSNGYSTPLKKRRVVMSECSDTAEAPSPTSINHNSFMSEAIAESSANDSELLAEEIKSEKESVVEVAVTEPVDSEKPDDTIKTNEESMDVEDDVDIMGSPPPEDKIVVEDNLVKIEPSDEDNDVRVDIEDATISEQIKEKVETVDQPINNLIGSVSEEKILSSCSEDKCTEENLISNVVIKTESSTSDSMEVATTVVKDEKPVSVDEFDIKPLAEAEKESVVPGTNTEIEEIADIQSLLQSFHSTNIKILETRNKKSTKSRLSSTSSRRDSVSPPPSNSIADSSSVSNNNLDQSTQSTTGITRRRKSRFEPQTKEEIVKTEQSLLAIEKNFSTATNEGGNGSMTVCPATDIPIHQRNPNSTIPVFNQNVLNACSASTLSMYQLQDVTQPGYMGPNQIVLPQFGQQLAYNMPQYPEEPVKTHIITQPQAPATRLLTDFFDKANNKITTTNNVFSSEIGYKSSMLEPNRTAFFPNHQTPASSLSSLSSTFLSNKPFNATTNNIEPTPVNSDRTTLTQTSSSLTAQSRVLSRSQSADPRLNPNLNTPTPPAAPKRKLSINEYRKRKQQSTDTVYSDRNEMKKDSPTPSVSNESSCDVKESLNSTDPLNPEETVVFSSAPTQLERQQEMLIERLKNMKGLKTSFNSINNLDNTINPDKTMSDDVTNLTSTKLNKLSESMNSLTSISSTSTISPATTPVHMSPSHSQDMFYLEDVNVPINSVIADTPKNESAGNEVAAVDEENK